MLKYIINFTNKPINKFWINLSQTLKLQGINKNLFNNSLYLVDEKNIQELLVNMDKVKNYKIFLFCDKENQIEIQNKYQSFVDAIFVNGTENLELKILSVDIAYNKKSLSSIFTNTFKTNLLISSDKNKKVSQLENALKTLKINSRELNLILNTFDEILMNGIYDAPINVVQNIHTLKNMNRDSMLILEKPIDVEIILKPDFLIFQVVDYYGSFDSDTLTNIMLKNNKAELYEPIDDSESKGAGLGLTLAFNRGASFIFDSDKFNKTSITAFFPLYNDFKNFKSHEKFLINNLWKK